MEKSLNQVEKNVTASFAYVKKDILMLNDSYTKMQDAITQLANSYKVLADELKSLKADLKKPAAKKAKKAKATTTKKSKTKAKPKKKTAKKNTSDKLTLIEGIGPAIEKLLKKNNIKTFKTLGKATVKDLRDILGTKFQMHDPSSWPKQARLAAKGDMIALGKLQEELDGGRKPAKKK